MKLLEHQEWAVEHAAEANARGHGTMLFHSMGTGKTITALSICLKLFPKRPIVVYAPGFLKATWAEEKRLVNSKNSMTLQVFDINDLLKIGKNAHSGVESSIVIVDEAHYLQDLIPKNPEIFRYLRSFHRAYFLTGTPFRSDIDELPVYINILAKKTVIPVSIDEFKKRYSIPLTRPQKMWNNWFVKSFSTVLLVHGFQKRVRNEWANRREMSWEKIRAMAFAPPKSWKYLYVYQPLMLLAIDAMAPQITFQPSLNVKALAAVMNPYITITSSRSVKSNSLRFPDVTTARQLFSYTDEQRTKLLGMLAHQSGAITDANVKNLFGDEVSNADRNALLPNMMSRITGGKNKTGGSEISRLSGWGRSEVPAKFVFIADRCASTRRIVLYSRYQTVASNLVAYLERRGFRSRICDLNKTYPKIDLARMQSGFFGAVDIVVLHPKMIEGISIKGASELIIVEPFTDAASKQQLEARVVRLGSHANVPENHVNIVTCVTGIDLMSDPFENAGILAALRDAVKLKLRDLRVYMKTFSFGKVVEMPPWMQMADTSHLHMGPEVTQQLRIVSLESLLDSFKAQAESLLHV